MQKLFASIC